MSVIMIMICNLDPITKCTVYAENSMNLNVVSTIYGIKDSRVSGTKMKLP
jgi:hypothetical protein